jgi:hypothetical protein
MHQKHLEVPVKKLWLESKASFTRGRHSYPYLVYCIKQASTLRDKQMTPLQRAAFNNYRSNKIFSIRCHIKGVSDVSVLAHYFNLFDQLFFFGSLRPLCEVSISRTEAKDTYSNGARCEGFCADGSLMGFKFWGKQREIVLYSREREGLSRSRRLECYLGVLLHEMLHAFFDLWGCENETCR